MKLSSAQVRFLRQQAHNLKPVVMIGGNGLTEAVIDEMNIALDTHELIKVKIRQERDDRAAITETICQQTNAFLVQSIGQIVMLFRPSKKNKITLPKN